MPRDTRTYITVHEGMPEHPKIEPLSDAAFRLWVETLCWCSRQRTDGKVPSRVWAKRGTAKARAELSAAGLAEPAEGGVYCHDYTEHQRTSEEIDEHRAKKAASGRKGGLAKAANAAAKASELPSESLASAIAPASGLLYQTPSETLPVSVSVSVVEKNPVVKSSDQHPKQRANEPPPSTGPDEPSETARLIAWWKLLYPSDKQPPSKLINDVGRQIKNMLTVDGFPADDIRAGLEAWSKRSNLGASLLPNIVHEIRNPPHANGRPRNQTETEDWLTEAMERAIQIDASKAQQRTEITA